MMTKVILMTLMIALVRSVEHKIPNCQKQVGVCCEVCQTKFFEAKCKCILDTGGIKFLAKMNRFVYMFFFIVLPLFLITLFFLRGKAKQYGQIIQRAKIDRRGEPVMFSDKEIHSKLDRITNKPRSTTLDAGVELGSGNELDHPLAEEEEE